MGIKDDIQILEQFEIDYFKTKGKYLQGLSTPEAVPVKDSLNSFTSLRVPHYETDAIIFTPTSKDYQFRVDVWSRLHEGKETSGFVVRAKRDLGDGIYETVTSEPETL